MKPKHLPLIPIMANEGNMEEIGGVRKVGKTSRREPGWVPFWWAFDRGEIILEVLEMPGTPQKQKGAAATITKQIQKLAKKNKPVTTKYFPFPIHSH